MSNPSEDSYDDYPDEDAFVPGVDPASDDEPPFFPSADPDAPETPDWYGVEPEGEQQPLAGDEGAV